ncbi:hypothetical protein [Desulfonema magnum]|uniref:Uncharacterized protein n=1 Tax=Desulfonema magnum TaxID=45655 RepID=A0A975BKM0_9BACT|nr:hypothetical protein [Desulfonema magnum]QTA87307.1 Uncharacterized protein dnm_033370 [Desulfonema magnum]
MIISTHKTQSRRTPPEKQSLTEKHEPKKVRSAEDEIGELFEMLDTPEWNEAFEYLAAH